MLQHAQVSVLVLLGDGAFAQIRFVEVGADQIGAAQRGPAHVHPAHRGAFKIGAAHVGAKEAGHVQLGAGEVGFFQHRAGEVGIGQVAPRQVQAGQIAEGEDRARPAHAPGLEHFVAGDGCAHVFLGELGETGMAGLGHGKITG